MYFQVVVKEKVVLSVGPSSKNFVRRRSLSLVFLVVASTIPPHRGRGQKLVLSGVFGKHCPFPSGMSRAFLGSSHKTVPFWVVASLNRALPSVSSLHFETIYSCWLDSAEALILMAISMAPLMRLIEGRPAGAKGQAGGAGRLL